MCHERFDIAVSRIIASRNKGDDDVEADEYRVLSRLGSWRNVNRSVASCLGMTRQRYSKIAAEMSPTEAKVMRQPIAKPSMRPSGSPAIMAIEDPVAMRLSAIG